MNRNKWLFRSIWLIALLPLLIAWSLAFFGSADHFKTKNHGELMPAGMYIPQDLKQAFDGKWGLLVFSQSCESHCQHQLYQMQQLHTAMGQDIDRIQPVWLSAQKINPKPADIDFNQVKALAQPDIVDWFNMQQLQWQDHSLWLIDPNGMLVMRFGPGVVGKHILADIDWLLKASHIG